jgi:hypothetical protein
MTCTTLVAPLVSAHIRPSNAPVAQLDRALPSEGRGHRFESCRVRQDFSVSYPCPKLRGSFGAEGLISRHYRTMAGISAILVTTEKCRYCIGLFSRDL